ncbi:Arc family DNA-binding protein [Asaia lannensis]|uniref:Arc family DNA-binding protein n=1 Tax=Asaia lannensis NBRC 102526 TaxID=1307926 RepID=A0ABT1CIJ6_9PROT|nr:Arc family DNA-binding protein [Asaia lannensis]MCO6160683.1 Arc family DNA-binding protein [Asaia lannensis NBRC 102526]
MVHFMAASDPQMKIRLPLFLKEQVSRHAQAMGTSMNQAIIDLLEDALAQLPTGYKPPPFNHDENKTNLEKEINFLWYRINSLNDDISNFSRNIVESERSEDRDTSNYRKFLIKRIQETDAEAEDLHKKVRILEDRLRSLKE